MSEPKKPSWLNLWWLLVTITAGFIAGLCGPQGMFVAAIAIVIIGWVALHFIFKKKRLKNGLELVVYMVVLGACAYGGLATAFALRIGWVLLAFAVFLFMGYLAARKKS